MVNLVFLELAILLSFYLYLSSLARRTNFEVCHLYSITWWSSYTTRCICRRHNTIHRLITLTITQQISTTCRSIDCIPTSPPLISITGRLIIPIPLCTSKCLSNLPIATHIRRINQTWGYRSSCRNKYQTYLRHRSITGMKNPVSINPTTWYRCPLHHTQI